ncbi:MAG: hypothetical protein QOH28_1496 [Actinomycetota bacterium]|jgi:hypothetical protein|nr:hypothetical protein [Actinomycetota bacterium]
MSTLAADARLAEVAVVQQGVFTRAQATASGFSASQIERRVRARVWERVLPGVYRHAATPASTTRAHWAAVLWAGPECALSHASAAAIWRIRGATLDRPELIVLKTRAPRVRGVLVHRVNRIDDHDVLRVERLPVTSPVRTIIDLAGVLGTDDLELALASARSRRLVTIRAVRGRLDEIGTVGRPGAARLRTLLAAIGSGRVDPSARMAG